MGLFAKYVETGKIINEASGNEHRVFRVSNTAKKIASIIKQKHDFREIGSRGIRKLLDSDQSIKRLVLSSGEDIDDLAHSVSMALITVNGDKSESNPKKKSTKTGDYWVVREPSGHGEVIGITKFDPEPLINKYGVDFAFTSEKITDENFDDYAGEEQISRSEFIEMCKENQD